MSTAADIPFVPAEVEALAQKAVDAAYGDSNDTEIDALRDALEAALNALGLPMPTPHDPDADEPQEV